MAEDSETKTSHPETPFTEIVKMLKSAQHDEELFDFTVNAALARVESYTDNTYVRGAKLPHKQLQTTYEHGLKLFKSELPDNLTVPFAQKGSAEIGRKDQHQRPVYERAFINA